jgi:hypothetical protein
MVRWRRLCCSTRACSRNRIPATSHPEVP